MSEDNDPRALMVDLSRSDFERYGRCAILRDGGFWFAETLSIHPAALGGI
ncbi:MAG: hypothetical protein SVR04_06370 [Spirochaetota bacterium]|nr:hypothetical protein [Spirochaetota bacterium]